MCILYHVIVSELSGSEFNNFAVYMDNNDDPYITIKETEVSHFASKTGRFRLRFIKKSDIFFS